MKVAPYVQVGDVPFTATPYDLLSRKGKPAQACRNGVGLSEMDYGGRVCRFQDSGQLEEVDALDVGAAVAACEVPLNFLGHFVRQ